MLADPELYSLIHATLELPESYRLKPETRIAEVPGWDSLGWVKVITVLENKCGMEFNIEDIENFETVAKLVEFVHKSKTV